MARPGRVAHARRGRGRPVVGAGTPTRALDRVGLGPLRAAAPDRRLGARARPRPGRARRGGVAVGRRDGLVAALHRAPPGARGAGGVVLSLVAIAAVAVVSLGVIFGLGIFPIEGRTIVPLAGMMIGNSMAATVLAGRRVVGEMRDNRREVEARLALGPAWRRGVAALRPRSARGRAHAADRVDQGGRPRRPARRDDRSHPGRRRPRRRRAGAARDHVPDPRIGGDERDRRRARPDPPALHPRPPLLRLTRRPGAERAGDVDAPGSLAGHGEAVRDHRWWPRRQPGRHAGRPARRRGHAGRAGHRRRRRPPLGLHPVEGDDRHRRRRCG